MGNFFFKLIFGLEHINFMKITTQEVCCTILKRASTIGTLWKNTFGWPYIVLVYD